MGAVGREVRLTAPLGRLRLGTQKEGRKEGRLQAGGSLQELRGGCPARRVGTRSHNHFLRSPLTACALGGIRGMPGFSLLSLSLGSAGRAGPWEQGL